MYNKVNNDKTTHIIIILLCILDFVQLMTGARSSKKMTF